MADQVANESIRKLEMQNAKLEQQLAQYNSTLKEIMDKSKKQQRNQQRVPKFRDQSPNEDFKSVDMRKRRLKKEIDDLKRRLQGNLNENEVINLENESRYLNKQIQQLERDNEGLVKIEANQKKAIVNAEQDDQYQDKLSLLQSELRELRDRQKELTSQYKQDEKHCKEQHEKVVVLQEKIRKIAAAIQESKQSKDKDISEFTNEDIDNLKYDFDTKQREAKREEKEVRTHIRSLRKKLKQVTRANEDKQILLKGKDQEYRITMVKLKEVKRLLQNNNIQQVPSRRKKLSKRQQISYQEQGVESEEEVQPQRSLQIPNSTFETNIEENSNHSSIEEEPVLIPENIQQPTSVFSKPTFNFR